MYIHEEMSTVQGIFFNSVSNIWLSPLRKKIYRFAFLLRIKKRGNGGTL
jgi:hypothetical protein